MDIMLIGTCDTLENPEKSCYFCGIRRSGWLGAPSTTQALAADEYRVPSVAFYDPLVAGYSIAEKYEMFLVIFGENEVKIHFD